MKDFLKEIVSYKKKEVEALKRRIPLESFAGKGGGCLAGFKAAISRPGLNLIAEIKKASPSKGIIRKDFDYLGMAKTYEKTGVAAVSVLTEEKYFLGSLCILKEVTQSINLPVLRKDFIIDPYQIHEAAFHNASAVLLIVALLNDRDLKGYLELAGSLKMAALVEVHTGKEAERAMACGADIIGINNRDLTTFKTDLSVTLSIMKTLQKERVVTVSESGIRNADDARLLKKAGVNALLVGEAIMTAPDPAGKIKELLV